MAKQEPWMVDLFVKTHGEGNARWGNDGRRKVAKVKGLTSFTPYRGRNLHPRAKRGEIANYRRIQDSKNDYGMQANGIHRRGNGCKETTNTPGNVEGMVL